MSNGVGCHSAKFGDAVRQAAIVNGQRTKVVNTFQRQDVHPATTRGIRNYQHERPTFTGTRACPVQLGGGKRNRNSTFKECRRQERLDRLYHRRKRDWGRSAHVPSRGL